MSEYAWAMLVYCSLQGASLAVLPRWWKMAAAPALLLVPQIVHERLQPSYMSEAITVMLAIFVCAYLVFVWIALGITKLVQRCRRDRGLCLRPKTKNDDISGIVAGDSPCDR